MDPCASGVRSFVPLQRMYAGLRALPTLLLGLIDVQESRWQRETRIKKNLPGRRRKGQL